MGIYEDQVLPRIINVTLGGKPMARLRARVASSLSGDVLEVGFGSGLNVPHYPDGISRVRAVDPALVGRQLAAKRVAASPVPVEYIGLDGEELPVDTASVDHVLITWTMCTIPNIDGALSEMYRALRPGGQLHFVEHGRSPDASVSKWQDRLNPLQGLLFGGCHINRPIDHLVEHAGFTMTELQTFYMPGPKPFGYMYEGIATKQP